MAPPRLADIARILGLNISTVSRALAGDPRVKDATRKKILALSEALGYRPHMAARALAAGKAHVLWFVIPGLNNPIDREPAWWAGQYLVENGYDLLLAQHYGRPGVYSRILDRLSNGSADGAVIIPPADDASCPEAMLLRMAVPFVFLDRKNPGVDAPTVTSANRAGCGQLLAALAPVPGAGGCGPETVCVVNAFGLEPDNPVVRARLEGTREAAAGSGFGYCELRASGAGGAGVSGLPERFPSADRLIILATERKTVLDAWAAVRAASAAANGEGSRPGAIREMSAGVFDGWHGETAPFLRVAVAVQNFRGMAEQAVRLVLAMLEDRTDADPGAAGPSIPGVPQAPELLIPLLRIDILES